MVIPLVIIALLVILVITEIKLNETIEKFRENLKDKEAMGAALEEPTTGNAENTETTENKLHLTNGQLVVIYGILSGACLIGLIVATVQNVSKILSEGFGHTGGMLSIAFACVCYVGWYCFALKLSLVKGKLKKVSSKE